MKHRIYKCLAALGILALVGSGAYVFRAVAASNRRWELGEYVPTTSIEYSKRFGVFVDELDPNPARFELDGSVFEIRSVWIEHHVDLDRVDFFTAKTPLLPALYLAVRIKLVSRNPKIVPPAIEIVSSPACEVYGLYTVLRPVLISEVGSSVPTSFMICDALDGTVKIALSRKPNQSTDPTP